VHKQDFLDEIHGWNGLSCALPERNYHCTNHGTTQTQLDGAQGIYAFLSRVNRQDCILHDHLPAIGDIARVLKKNLPSEATSGLSGPAGKFRRQPGFFMNSGMISLKNPPALGRATLSRLAPTA
jgi:hypothetical protein